MFRTIICQRKCLSVSQSYICANFLGSKNYSSIKNRKFKGNLQKHHSIMIGSDTKKQVMPKGLKRATSQSLKSDDNILDGEDIDEEFDIYKYHHLKELEEQDKGRYKDLMTMKIVEKKYFKKEQEKVLSWSDKEHIRYLHNTDPHRWTYEVLAGQFQVDEKVIKAVAKAKWLSKKPKLLEENMEDSNSSLFLNEHAEPSKKEISKVHNRFPNRKISFKEFCAESGTKMADKSYAIKPLSVIENQDSFKPTHQETLLEYVTGEGENDKWVSQNENLKLYIDQDQTGNTNVYYYDNQHGYQHPFGKSGSNADEDGTPLIKEGELIRRGDDFYDEDGEFLFRVPGLCGNKL